MNNKREEIRALIKDTRSLPTIPGIISKLNAMSASDKTSIQEMARVVSSDQVLSARILRLANSPSYGFYRVSTISNAMILLGVDVVKSLALSSSIFEIMETSILGLWEHSLGAGVAANIIAKRLRLPDCEEIATAALLHDIGKVIIKIKFSDEYNRICDRIKQDQSFFSAAEMEELGTDHAEIGGWLAKSWYLPDKLIEPIACHHSVALSVNHRIKTAVVHLADVLIKASGFGHCDDDFVPSIQQVAWDQLDMSEQLLAEIVEELEDKLVEVKNFSLDLQSTNVG